MTFIDSQFDFTGNSPGSWFFSGHFLHASAETLRRDFKHQMDPRFPVYGLLLGYTCEAYLKALWLARGGVLAKDGRFVRIPGTKDHQLLQLADAVRFPLTDPERDIVKRLSAFVLFSGRYPIPTNASQFQFVKHPGGGMVMPGYFIREDWDSADAIVRRVRAEVSTEIDLAQEPPQ